MQCAMDVCNLALLGLEYTPDAYVNGEDNIVITVSDAGATGSGGVMIARKNVSVMISP